jgi:hypothetical protein
MSGVVHVTSGESSPLPHAAPVRTPERRELDRAIVLYRIALRRAVMTR